MTQTIIHTVETAPEASKPLLRGALKAFGFIPNLLGTLAQSPAALESYLSLSAAFGKTSLSPTEQQLVLIAVSIENGCYYCVAAHTFIAKAAGVRPELLEQIRSGTRLSDPKLEALVGFTRKLVLARGFVERADVAEFTNAGYGPQQVQEVLVGLTQKTLSNYSNHLTQLPVDPQFAADTWAPVAEAAE